MSTRLRVAIIGDVHGNYTALEAVLRDAGAVDQVWFLGDAVNHGPQPNECIELLNDRCALGVLGDHDRAVLGDPGPQFTRIPLLADALAWTKSVIRPTCRRLLAQYVERIEIGELTLVHDLADLARSPEERPSARLPDAADFARIRTRHCLYGHMHLPIVCRLIAEGDHRPQPNGSTVIGPNAIPSIDLDNARVIANPGSAGFLEWEDGFVAYLLADLDPSTGAGRLWPRCVSFDASDVLAKARQVGMPEQVIAFWKRCVAHRAFRDGDIGSTKTLLAESLRTLNRAGNARQLGHALAACGRLAMVLDRPEHAAQLVAASVQIGAHPTVTYRADVQRPTIEAALATDTFARAWQTGQKMTIAQAVELAFAVVA